MRVWRPSVGALVGVIGLALSACSDSASNRLTSPKSPSSLELDRTTGKPQIVTGGVEFLLPEAPGIVTPTRYEMAAIRNPSGDVKGELEIHVQRATDQVFHGELVCFQTVGNSAHLAARVTRSNVDFVPPGTYLAWSVVDNGEGRRSAPDQTSNFFIVSEQLALLHCMNGGINPPLYPVAHGNIQVH